ncbi:MAG: ribosome biogenesis GTP-binding protein YihA/YsxC [Alphaproteobacteria bacterium]|nr:ribosome biogenesis GTP-binding protein YihA/YsxC [Alphaproteobacteria bacterium]
MKLDEFYSAAPKFIASFPMAAMIPASSEPEIAFIGRSNVGKSSLINAIFKSPLAKTSSTPGRTQTMNFFEKAKMLMVVDLPGYGFAEAPVKIVEEWNRQLRLYLSGRAQLKRVFLLIDSRRGLADVDIEMMGMLDTAGVSYQVVLTKTDKLKPAEIAAARESLDAIFKKHPAMHPDILTSSSSDGTGLDLLRRTIMGVARV